MKKPLTVPYIYGEDIDRLREPNGFRFVLQLRAPGSGEWYLCPVSRRPLMSVLDHHPADVRLILARVRTAKKWCKPE